MYMMIYENCEVCERSLKRFGVPSVGVKSSEFADSALLTWGILILVCFICYFLFNNNSHVRHYLFYSSFLVISKFSINSYYW